MAKFLNELLEVFLKPYRKQSRESSDEQKFFLEESLIKALVNSAEKSL